MEFELVSQIEFFSMVEPAYLDIEENLRWCLTGLSTRDIYSWYRGHRVIMAFLFDW